MIILTAFKRKKRFFKVAKLLMCSIYNIIYIINIYNIFYSMFI